MIFSYFIKKSLKYIEVITVEFISLLKIRSAYFGAKNIVKITKVQALFSANIFFGIFISSSDNIEVL